MIKLVKGLFEGDGVLTQGFGEHPEWYKKYGLLAHNGIDYGIPTGRKLYSCIDGEVIEAQLDATGYGNYVKIENDTCGVLYGHLKSFAVKVGDKVKVGQVIGLSNNTGNSTGPHLHFGVFPKPRDRGNGYSGYINPFDKKLVTWLDAPESDCEVKLSRLQEEVIDVRESRDKWKTKYEELDQESTKDLQAKIKHIEELQKTVAEQSALIATNTGGNADNLAEIAKLREEVAVGKDDILVLKDLLEESAKENKRLADKLKECQAGNEEVGGFIAWLKKLFGGGV